MAGEVVRSEVWTSYLTQLDGARLCVTTCSRRNGASGWQSNRVGGPRTGSGRLVIPCVCASSAHPANARGAQGRMNCERNDVPAFRSHTQKILPRDNTCHLPARTAVMHEERSGLECSAPFERSVVPEGMARDLRNMPVKSITVPGMVPEVDPIAHDEPRWMSRVEQDQPRDGRCPRSSVSMTNRA